ncbi:MAG TPA: M28 family peptidase [Caulobacteraceae bacterium]|nr:M28 family peptidase [Caulobacteraceae bacterium]
MPRIAALLAVLAAGFALFYHYARTPPPAPASAPATEFSAGRAMADIANLAPVPHPIGSPANALARDYLLARMRQLGLTPRIQRGEAQRADPRGGEMWIGGAHVENLVGVLSGVDPNLPAVALMAHYDSVPGSPGAADDSTGVADALEIVRAIEARGKPRRDVMVVLTDGEEAGLLGATSFFADDAAARHVGFLLNLEARGGGGRASMFETGAGNGAAVSLFRRTARRPSANSLAVFVYKLLPNDTDYTVAKAAGVSGFNFAFIGREFDYHSPSSTVAALDQGAVQQMGEQALGPARAMAFAPDLPPKTSDAVYGNLVGDFILAYPTWVGWLVLAAIGVLIALAARRARRARELSWLDGLQGAGAALLLLAGGALALHLTRALTGVGFGWMEGRPLLARFPTFEVAMGLAALSAGLFVTLGLALGEARFAAIVLIAAAGLACSAFGGFDAAALIEAAIAAVLVLVLLGRPARSAGAWVGMLAVGWLAVLALQILAPTTTAVIAWPLAAGALVAVLLIAPTWQVAPRWVVALVVMTGAVAFAASLFHSFLQAMDRPELPALSLWLAAMSLWPALWPRARLINASLAGVSLCAAVAIALWLHFTSPWSPRHPRAAEPLFLVSAGHAWRASPLEPDRWTAAVLKAEGGQITRLDVPSFSRPLWVAPAAPVAVPAPVIDTTRSVEGTISLHFAMAPQAMLRLDLRTGASVTSGAIDGKPEPILDQPGRWTHLVWQAAPDGVTAAFRPIGHGTLEIRYAQFTPGWPATAKPLPLIPPRLMGWDRAGSTVVAGALTTSW